MEIVEYKKVHLDKIINFLKEAHKYINKELDLSGKDSDLNTLDTDYGQPGAGFWCVINNSQIIGTMGLRPFIENGIKYIELRRLYVDPIWQNRGIGSQLLDFAINFSKLNGYNAIRTTTSFDRTIIIYLLQKRQFYQIQKYRKSSADLFYELTLEPKYKDFYQNLDNSFRQGELYFKNTLILNPVENVPDNKILEPCSTYLHGLYNTDSIRNNEQKIDTKIQFSGRDAISEDINKIYHEWGSLLGGEAVSMRLLSGLHAHTVVFMGLTSIGDHVVILPEVAGGHMATKAILQRLGLIVHELVVDYEMKKIDVEASLKLIKECSPKVIFIDRSEGLIYEDFSWLKKINAYKIFDASQYLTNIISNDYTNPFSWGFDMILSTLHKNLPGPQRAMICAKSKDENWNMIRSAISTYVSNMHVFSIYSAGIILKDYEALKALSKNMILNTIVLENELEKRDIPIVRIVSNELHTHHLWLLAKSKKEAFKWYLDFERLGLLVNYRKLPYNLGYGLRLGLSAATNCGLCIGDIPKLAEIIDKAIKHGYSENLKLLCNEFILKVKRKDYGK